MYGSDQAASLEPTGMKYLTDSISKYLLAIGKPSLGEIIPERPIAKKLKEYKFNFYEI